MTICHLPDRTLAALPVPSAAERPTLCFAAALKQEAAEHIRAIFTALDNQEVLRLLNGFLDDYRKDASDLVKWAESALPGLVMMQMP
jgi:hypothetical protein